MIILTIYYDNINPYATDYILVCIWMVENAKNKLYCACSTRETFLQDFFSNSEADASLLLVFVSGSDSMIYL